MNLGVKDETDNDNPIDLLHTQKAKDQSNITHRI